jgi:hypothetical protein
VSDGHGESREAGPKGVAEVAIVGGVTGAVVAGFATGSWVLGGFVLLILLWGASAGVLFVEKLRATPANCRYGTCTWHR